MRQRMKAAARTQNPASATQRQDARGMQRQTRQGELGRDLHQIGVLDNVCR
jgi:hypothetical protein